MLKKTKPAADFGYTGTKKITFAIHEILRALGNKDIAFCGIRVVLLAFIFGAGHISVAQKTAPNPEGYWISYTGDNKITSRIGIHSEAQLRNLFLPHTVQTILVRVGLNVYIQPYAMGTVGYGYFFSEPSNSVVNAARMSEHRIWQQLVFRQKSRHVFMEHRFRQEQRFLHNMAAHTHKVDHRIRYRFQALFPLYSISPHLRHLFLSVNNEIMLNYRKNPTEIFDRNRFFAGLGYQVSPKMNFQLGYLNQFAQVSGSMRGQTDHIIQAGVSYNMDDLMQTFFKKGQEK